MAPLRCGGAFPALIQQFGRHVSRRCDGVRRRQFETAMSRARFAPFDAACGVAQDRLRQAQGEDYLSHNDVLVLSLSKHAFGAPYAFLSTSAPADSPSACA